MDKTILIDSILITLLIIAATQTTWVIYNGIKHPNQNINTPSNNTIKNHTNITITLNNTTPQDTIRKPIEW